MSGYKVLDVLRADTVETVDCGTCPVNIACAAGKGGTGYTYTTCCRATGVYRGEGADMRLLMIDCSQHHFEIDVDEADMGKCPLCTGDAVTIDIMAIGTPTRWIPTVHAAISATTRLDTFRRHLPIAQKVLAKSEKRKKAL